MLPNSDEIIVIHKGKDGYYRTDKYGHDREAAQAIVDEYNSGNGMTKAQGGGDAGRFPVWLAHPRCWPKEPRRPGTSYYAQASEQR